MQRTDKNSNIFYRIFMFYYDGFKNMTVGKSLWIIILAKLFILFFVIKLLFFPNILKRDYSTDEQRAEAVRHSLMEDNR
jgi:flagellar basal body-associated protein FliL